MKEKKYFTLYNIIKNKILSGEYKRGEKLPSKRVMCDKTGMSVITVEKAYSMLIEEGYIIARERSGYYVSLPESFSKTGIESRNIRFNYLDENDVEKRTENFEYSLWFKTVRKVISEKGERLFSKAPNMGCAVLRNALADYLLRYRGMVAPPERIIIGSGAEQLYESVVKILGREKKYGIENPSYPQIEAVYKGEGAEVYKLKMESDGIEINELKNSNADVLHVTPYKSYPTNITTSLSKRYEYLKWAGNEKYIVEDDFNSEFFAPGQPIKSLYQLDNAERVIYINTFSKSLTPSMRLGYMILPERLIATYNELLGNFSCSVPVFDQYILAEFISSGNFERHLNRMRRKIQKN